MADEEVCAGEVGVEDVQGGFEGGVELEGGYCCVCGGVGLGWEGWWMGEVGGGEEGDC